MNQVIQKEFLAQFWCLACCWLQSAAPTEAAVRVSVCARNPSKQSILW